MKFGLEDSTLCKMNAIFKQHSAIEMVIIYGSRAKGNYREGSDIDLALKGEKLDNEIRSMVWLKLDELNTPYLIDILVYDLTSNASLIEHIDRAGQILYKKGD